MAISFALKSLSPKFMSLIEETCILTSKKSQYGGSQKVYCYKINHQTKTVYVALGAWREMCEKFPWSRADYPPTDVKFTGTLMTPETDLEKGYRDQTQVSRLLRQKLATDHTAFLAAATGFGKCFDPSQRLVMMDRSVKAAKDIRTGDLLLGDDWTPRQVTSTISGNGNMYEVLALPLEVPVLKCNGDHILCLKPLSGGQEIIEIALQDYLKMPEQAKESLGLYTLPLAKPMGIPPDPTKHAMVERKGKEGEALTQEDFRVLGSTEILIYVKNFFRRFSDNGVSFFRSAPSPAALVSFEEACRKTGVLVTKNQDTIWVHPPGAIVPFKIRETGQGPYSGFTVSGSNRRFFLESSIVTHNTTIGCEVAARSKVKVAILCFFDIVRKQWVKALKSKTTGKVQKVVKNKLDPSADFYVIGVTKVNSIPIEELEGIGGVIVDEAHVTVKATFEEALLKFQPLWVLGLSATPRRSDGLQSVLEMYFGSKKDFIVRRETKPFKVYKIETNFEPKVRTVRRGPKGETLDWGLVVSSLAESKERLQFIADRLVEVLQDPEEYLLVLTLRVDEGVAVAELLREALEEGKWELGPNDHPVLEIFGKQKGDVKKGKMTREEIEKMSIVSLRKLAKLNGVFLKDPTKANLRSALIKIFTKEGGLYQEVRGGIKAVDRDGVRQSWTNIPPEAGFYRVQVVGMKKGGVGYDDPTRTSEALLDSVKDVEQYEGRVRMRDCSIYDFVDDFGTLENHWSSREKHYLDKGGEIVIEPSEEPRKSARKKRGVFIPGRFGGV